MNNIIQSIFGFIPKLLMVLCIVLLAFILKLNHELTNSANHITLLEKDQVVKIERLKRIEGQLETIENSIVEARASWQRLNSKIDSIDNRTLGYKTQVEKVKSENEEVKNLLDTKLPDDFKRLLSESTGGEN